MRTQVSDRFGSNQFFFAAVGSADRLRQEVFYLSYHLHWTYTEVMDLDIVERREYVRLLAERIEQENRAINRASRRGAG